MRLSVTLMLLAIALCDEPDAVFLFRFIFRAARERDICINTVGDEVMNNLNDAYTLTVAFDAHWRISREDVTRTIRQLGQPSFFR
jgi:hypothetical protein